MNNLYFDNAATSYPKPRSVYKAVCDAMLFAGGNPGRSAHKLSQSAATILYETREALCEFFGGSAPERVIFTPSATFALNTAIFSLKGNFGSFLISDFEHNATLRPIVTKAEKENAEVRVFKTYDDPDLTLRSFESAITNDCRGVIVNAASNVNGRCLPINEIGKICKDRNITYIVDASQLAGHEKINIAEVNCDFLCSAAHKGLFSPMGCGFMILTEKAEEFEPLIYGGNGVNSLSFDMGSDLPERFEAGTPPVALIAGLNAGIKFINSAGVDNVKIKGEHLKKYLKNKLLECENYSIYDSRGSIPIISISHKHTNCERVCEQLSKYGISTRGGIHCAPLAHRAMGTVDGGTVRISMGYFNTEKDIDVLIEVLRKI